MAPSQRVIAEHRILLAYYIAAKAVLKGFDGKFLEKGVTKQNHFRYARDKYIQLLPAAIKEILADDMAARFPVQWLGAKYREFDKATVGQICEQTKKVLAHLQKTQEKFPSTQDPAGKTQYWGAKFKSLAIIGVPVGYLISRPEAVSPLVYAHLDANSTVHFVKSNNQNVRVADILFFQRAIELDFETNIKFRQRVSMVCTHGSAFSHFGPAVANQNRYLIKHI